MIRTCCASFFIVASRSEKPGKIVRRISSDLPAGTLWNVQSRRRSGVISKVRLFFEVSSYGDLLFKWHLVESSAVIEEMEHFIQMRPLLRIRNKLRTVVLRGGNAAKLDYREFGIVRKRRRTIQQQVNEAHRVSSWHDYHLNDSR